MTKKLIIWDFDGVIADTDSDWLVRLHKKVNNVLGMNISFDEFHNKYCGMSSITQRRVFNEQGFKTSDFFWKELRRDHLKSIIKNFPIIEGACNTIRKNKNPQCVATGTPPNIIKIKIKLCGLSDVFDKKNVFSSSFVKKGKPEPDLFLLAAKTMGFEPKNCIVIEDSIAGLTAALRANMTPIAFVGCPFNNNNNYKRQVAQLGVKYIFDNMKDVENFINSEMVYE